MSLEKKHTLRELLCRGVQSVFLAAEITVLADMLFAAGETPLPRAAFWGLFLAAAAALSLWRGFTRKARRIACFAAAGAACSCIFRHLEYNKIVTRTPCVKRHKIWRFHHEDTQKLIF